MPDRPPKLLPFLVVASLALVPALGCGSRDDDGPAAAMPTATSIPMGAPGAEGARFEPAALPKPPKSSSIRQKINPDNPDAPPVPVPEPEESSDPLTPPSPFGTPAPEPTPIHPPVPPMKQPKGTKI